MISCNNTDQLSFKELETCGSEFWIIIEWPNVQREKLAISIRTIIKFTKKTLCTAEIHEVIISSKSKLHNQLMDRKLAPLITKECSEREYRDGQFADMGGRFIRNNIASQLYMLS